MDDEVWDLLQKHPRDVADLRNDAVAETVVAFLVWRASCEKLPSSTTPQDVAQTAYAKALQGWPTYQGKGPKAWFSAIVRNHVCDLWKAWVPMVSYEHARHDVVARPAPSPADLSDLIHRLPTSLTHREREVVIRRVLMEQEYPGIASDLECTEGAVRAALHTALTKLRERTNGGWR